MHKMLSLGLLSLSLFACGEKTEDTAGDDVVKWRSRFGEW